MKMKKRIKRHGSGRPSPASVNARRERLMKRLEGRPGKERPIPNGHNGWKAVIFQSELDYLSRCILDCPDIETGGQLFGYWTEDGTPVVLYAIGPGPGANHQTAFFNQDVNYLLTVGNAVKDRYGLHHIGEWHSHHRLGLARPSRHDVNTMVSAIRKKDLGCFLLCIGNIEGDLSTIRPFHCDDVTCTGASWSVIPAGSPVRALADRELSDILVHPETPSPSRKPSGTAGNGLPYPPGYWLAGQGGAEILNRILVFLKKRNPHADDVKPFLTERGEVVVRIRHRARYIEDVLLPDGFPGKAPLITRFVDGRLLYRSETSNWKVTGDGLGAAFARFYDYNK